MNILSAKSTKNVFHKGKEGNVYQLDSIANQLNIEKKLQEKGHHTTQVDSPGREQEALDLVHLVHKENYLDIFKSKHEGICYLSNGLMAQDSLYPLSLEHALISKDIIDLSIKDSACFSTIGGGHHCEYGKPLGFGLVNSMAISALYSASLGHRVAVLDLDTHYSNGCNDLLHQKENILMCSLWNQVIPAWKYADNQNNLVHERTRDVDDYFGKLDSVLEKIRIFNPSLLIYHLGFDVLETDRMGGVAGMDDQQLLKREGVIKSFLNSLKIPYAIYRGGAYIRYTGTTQEQEKRKEDLLETQIKIITSYI